ncbi:MAG: hypothetical protein LIO96_11775 [Lachnospiraceae bacterium]|nr:hypothetical protein [Lachnospiraceae bacterium]
MIWSIILALVVGLAAGTFITSIIFKKSAIGSLRIDKSDPDCGPLLFLELDEPVENLKTGEVVIMDVIVENLVAPQEKHSL